MNWIEYEQPEGKKIPIWMRTLGASKESSDVFVPAAIAGDEQEVLLCAQIDAVLIAKDSDHYYVPASWLSNTYPDTKALCDLMVAQARKSLSPNDA